VSGVRYRHETLTLLGLDVFQCRTRTNYSELHLYSVNVSVSVSCSMYVSLSVSDIIIHLFIRGVCATYFLLFFGNNNHFSPKKFRCLSRNNSKTAKTIANLINYKPWSNELLSSCTTSLSKTSVCSL